MMPSVELLVVCGAVVGAEACDSLREPLRGAAVKPGVVAVLVMVVVVVVVVVVAVVMVVVTFEFFVYVASRCSRRGRARNWLRTEAAADEEGSDREVTMGDAN